MLSQPGVKWVIFSDDPINDLGSTSPPPTSAQLIAGLQQLISTAHQNGIKFLCSTLTPYQGAGYWTQQGETAREAYNAFVLGSGSGCDGVIDQAAATSNPSDPTMYLPAYDSGDHLHPNDAGYQAIANAVNLNLFGSAPSLTSSLAATFNNVGITADNNTAPGNFDGDDASFSETALTNAGAARARRSAPPARALPSRTWPPGPTTTPSPKARPSACPAAAPSAFLVSASYGPASGTGTITYTDGSTQSYTLDAPDWWSAAAPSGGAVAVNSAYQNRPGQSPPTPTRGDIFSETVTLTAGKTLASVTLPPGGALTAGTPALHVFAMPLPAARGPYGGTAAAVPGTVQAANYDTGGQGVAYNVTSVNGTANSYRSDGVDLETTADTRTPPAAAPTTWAGRRPGSGSSTPSTSPPPAPTPSASGWPRPTGSPTRCTSPTPPGTNLSGAVAVPDTGGWQTWTTVDRQRHPAGRAADAHHRPGQRRLELPLHGLHAASGGTGSPLTASPSSLTFGGDHQLAAEDRVVDSRACAVRRRLNA